MPQLLIPRMIWGEYVLWWIYLQYPLWHRIKLMKWGKRNGMRRSICVFNEHFLDQRLDRERCLFGHFFWLSGSLLRASRAHHSRAFSLRLWPSPSGRNWSKTSSWQLSPLLYHGCSERHNWHVWPFLGDVRERVFKLGGEGAGHHDDVEKAYSTANKV